MGPFTMVILSKSRLTTLLWSLLGPAITLLPVSTQQGSAPMLVMTCLLDVVAVPESALSIARSRPNAWLVGLPGCGHNMLNERGDDLLWLMSDFLLRKPKHL